MQESQTEKEEMRQQQRMKIRTDMTRKIKSMVRMDAKNSLWSAFLTGQEVETRALHPRLSRERPRRAPDFPSKGRHDVR